MQAHAERRGLLIRLGITLEQASWLKNLSNEDIDRLAFGCGAPMIRLATRAFQRGVSLYAHVGKQHAAALVSARLPANKV